MLSAASGAPSKPNSLQEEYCIRKTRQRCGTKRSGLTCEMSSDKVPLEYFDFAVALVDLAETLRLVWRTLAELPWYGEGEKYAAFCVSLANTVVPPPHTRTHTLSGHTFCRVSRVTTRLHVRPKSSAPHLPILSSNSSIRITFRRISAACRRVRTPHATCKHKIHSADPKKGAVLLTFA